MGEKNHWLFHSLEVSELSIQGHHHSAIRKQPELLKCRRQFILLGIPDKRIQGTSTQCCLHCQLSGSSFTFSFCQNSTNVFWITMYPALEMNPLKKERICFWLTQTVHMCEYNVPFMYALSHERDASLVALSSWALIVSPNTRPPAFESSCGAHSFMDHLISVKAAILGLYSRRMQRVWALSIWLSSWTPPGKAPKDCALGDD